MDTPQKAGSEEYLEEIRMFSLASIATMAACIFLFGLFFSIIMNFQYIVHKAEEGVAITVFFNEDATAGAD